ncbi:uncharacterized protein [Clytia hemisphaerica]|uniref:C2H2-type domain-containing protein n=1 Tax=Clytia hemisphaerica TaxID=252671 RepID=A0A7M5WV10_9CNID
MANIEEAEITFQQQEPAQNEPPADLSSFQFVPEKIVDFSILQDGQRSYCVRWKDSWLTEELLSLTYQHLINEFWSTAAANVNKEQTEKVKKSKATNIKIINKQDNYEAVSVQPQYQTTSITVTSPGSATQQLVDNEANLKEMTETAAAAQLIDHSGILKQQVIPKLPDQTGINANTLSSMVVTSDVTLAAYPNEANPPTMIPQQPTIPKYQQALQQSISIQQQQLNPDSETGKVTFPKHVFSQARFVNKKQQQTLVSSEQPRVNCDICQKSLKTKKMLWAHKVAVHFGGNFPCEICGKKCITGAELRRHMTSHSTERRFVCQYCGLAYKRWSHLYQHLRVHEEEKNFRCDVCHLNFKVQSELKDHCFAEHSDGKMVQCSVCKHKLQTPLAVYHHSMKHTGTRDFICEICGSNFKRKQHLVTHMKTHLTEKKATDGSEEVYHCQACDESFTLKMDLKAHCTAAHPLLGDESVACRTCQKRLKVSHSVYLHGLRHFGARDFKCTLCNQFFKRKAHLLRHSLDRHPEQPRERKKRTVQVDGITCDLCQKSFKYKNALVKHMTTQHGILPSQDPSTELGIVVKKGIKRPHKCDVCSKRFKSKNGLAKHKVNKHSLESENSIVILGEDGSKDLEEKGNVREEDEVDDDDDEDIETDSETETPQILQNQAIAEPQLLQNQSVELSSSSRQKSEPMEVDQQQPEMVDHDDNVLHELDVTTNSDDKDATNNFRVVPIEHFNTSTGAGTSNVGSSADNVPHQVITVDEATGQIILMTTNAPPSNQQDVKDNKTGPSDVGTNQIIPVDDASRASPIITVRESDQSTSAAFEGQAVDPSQIRALTSAAQQQQLTTGQLQQVQIGQILNQDGVTLASVPIQSVQGVGDGQNIINFSQGSNEQIVVLLSALNSENIQQIQ